MTLLFASDYIMAIFPPIYLIDLIYSLLFYDSVSNYFLKSTNRLLTERRIGIAQGHSH